MEALPIWAISDADQCISQRLFLVWITSGMLGNPSSSRYAEERKTCKITLWTELFYICFQFSSTSTMLQLNKLNFRQTVLNLSVWVWSKISQFHIVSYAILSINFSKNAWGLFSIFKLLYVYSCSIHSFKKMWENFH